MTSITRLDALEYLRDAGNHALMSSFPQGAVFAFDHDLRYLSAGGLGLADVGLSREMLEGKTIYEAFPAETAAAIEPLYRAALGGASTTMDVPYQGRMYLQRLAPVRDDDGQIVAGLGFTQDVTETRAAEAELRESEQRNRLTFEHAPIGKAIVELNGRWRQVNPAVTRLTGYTEQQLLTMTFQDITHPDDLDLDLDHLGRLVAGEIGSYQIEKRYFTATGRTVWVLLSVALVRSPADEPLYFIAQIQDITERKRQQQALQDMTAMLAHDLRTPATVIRGFAEIIEETAESDSVGVRNYAARIGAVAATMTDLLDNALTATTLDAGAFVAAQARVPLKRLISRLSADLELAGLEVDHVGIDDSLEVWVDQIHLTQVLTNLLTNAAKYGGDTVTLAASETKSQVNLIVTDNGRGVEPEFVPHLFDRFSRSPHARRGLQRGSGLGLFIVRDLLAANGASITYERGPTGGAAFVITLRTPAH